MNVTNDEKLAGLLNLKSFAAWLDTQNPATTYSFFDNGFELCFENGHTPGCALVQYLRAHGYDDVLMGTTFFIPKYDGGEVNALGKLEANDGRVALPPEMNEVVRSNRTFGQVKASIKKILEPA